MNSRGERHARGSWEVIGAAVMDGELLIKIVQRIKTVAGIEAFLVLPVAALHLAVVAGRVRDG